MAEPSEQDRARFDRARRRAILTQVTARLRPAGRERVGLLPLAETLDAVGRSTIGRSTIGRSAIASAAVSTRHPIDTAGGPARGTQLDLGCHTIPLASVAGTLTRSGDFDRSFAPLRAGLRDRWQRLAAAAAAGVDAQPISVLAVGGLYFVVDGHHRVSVANAFNRPTIEACVTRICTTLYACDCLTIADLPDLSARLHQLQQLQQLDTGTGPAGWAGLGCSDAVLPPPPSHRPATAHQRLHETEGPES